MMNKILNFFSFRRLFNSNKSKLNFLLKKKEIKQIFKILNSQKKINVMLVGGCVRKALKGEIIDDIDLATLFEPQEVKKKLTEAGIKVIETGISHGTVRVIINEKNIEITTLREDVSTDGRHAEVKFTNDWQIDALRRDLSINAIYLDENCKIYDPTGGIKDLENNQIRFIGDAEKRIKEDYLRILRYLRFLTQYGFMNYENETLKIIKRNLNGLNKISNERKLEELKKIIKLENFIHIFSNEEVKYIFLNIFPQLQHYNRLNRLKIFEKNFNEKLNPNLLIGILTIDKSDNQEYFSYKYKISNKAKQKFNFIKDNLENILKKNFFAKKNILKNVYFYNKEMIRDLIISSFFINNNISIDEIKNSLIYLNSCKKPVLPITGDQLIERGFESGETLGKILKKIESNWVSNDFIIDEKTIEKFLKN